MRSSGSAGGGDHWIPARPWPERGRGRGRGRLGTQLGWLGAEDVVGTAPARGLGGDRR
jgi:hypothetical protein